jgi:hypothetical protein
MVRASMTFERGGAFPASHEAAGPARPRSITKKSLGAGPPMKAPSRLLHGPRVHQLAPGSAAYLGFEQGMRKKLSAAPRGLGQPGCRWPLGGRGQVPGRDA